MSRPVQARLMPARVLQALAPGRSAAPIALLMAAASLLVACTAVTSTGQTGGGDDHGEAIVCVAPQDAIRIREDFYMTPLGVDESGCLQYSPWSSRGAVPTAIYYRKADGSFTLSRSDTGCSG